VQNQPLIDDDSGQPCLSLHLPKLYDVPNSRSESKMLVEGVGIGVSSQSSQIIMMMIITYYHTSNRSRGGGDGRVPPSIPCKKLADYALNLA
jgi:hypothetical protein